MPRFYPSQNKYLGKRGGVADVKKKGLDTIKEAEQIAKKIKRDYKKKKISKKTASGRMARLHNNIIPKSKKMVGKKTKAKQKVKKIWNSL